MAMTTLQEIRYAALQRQHDQLVEQLIANGVSKEHAEDEAADMLEHSYQQLLSEVRLNPVIKQAKIPPAPFVGSKKGWRNNQNNQNKRN